MNTFSFAGFDFPLHIPRLVALDYCGADKYGPALARQAAARADYETQRRAGAFVTDAGSGKGLELRNRIAGMVPRFKVDSAYFSAPQPLDGKADSFGFYLDSDFAPGLRWTWCDKVEGVRIDHTGWHTIEGGGTENARGLVLRLPHARGFLAGWSLGEGMCATVSRHMHEDEAGAAHAADSMAERAAEAEREYQAAFHAGQEARQAEDEAEAAAGQIKVLRRQIRQARLAKISGYPAICEALKATLADLADTVRESFAKRDALRDEWQAGWRSEDVRGQFAEGFAVTF